MKGFLKLKLIFTIAFLILLPLLLLFTLNGKYVRASGNTIEDNFARPDQVGWGTTTNSSGVPNVAWGMDGSGSQPFVTISNQTGRYGYQGSVNQIGIASAGATVYKGGDALALVQLSAVGHGTPYITLNACSNKSCYYGARLHTSQGIFELAKRTNNTTTIVAARAFSALPTTKYWLRLDVVPSNKRSTTLNAKIWQDGTAEPTNWLLSWNDNSPLAAGYPGAGGSWDINGTSEYFAYSCYAFASSGNAAPCIRPPGPTPTPTSSLTPPPTPTPIGTDSAHLIRSVNVSMFDTSDQFMNDTTTQTILRQHGTPIIRMPFRDGWTDAQYLQALKAIKNAAAAPLVIVHGACVSDPYTPDNYWLSLVAQVFPTGPVYVEYGNEEDLGCSGGSPITATQYQASWNSVVSRLKTNYPTFQFLGPVTYQANPTYIATFVNGANPQPDFLSWHEYVCSTSDSNDYCMSHINNWANHVNDTNTAVQKAIGHTIPIMITEWNLDPGSDQRYNDQTFIQQWTTNALNEWASLVNSGVYAAYIYTTESHPSFQLIDSNDNYTYQGQVFFL